LLYSVKFMQTIILCYQKQTLSEKNEQLL